jgi:polyferredoxin
MTRSYQFVRRVTQLLFLGTCLLIAVEFWQFAAALEQGARPAVARPPGVEAFLPISALVSLKYGLTTGVFNHIHPSALLILGFALAISFGVAKSFCSWVCPLGLLSESLYRVRKRLGLGAITIYGIPDTLLRSVKYLVLLFFVYTIFFQMKGPGLEGFIYSAYHMTADIKMLHFFTRISPGALGILATLVVLTFVFPYFWCRYLCPYGALMGMAGMVSPVKIRRNRETCTACGKCDRACPGRIRVSIRERVTSDECTACGRCVDACPEPETLSLGPGLRMMPVAVAVFVAMVFLGGSMAARGAGIWQNRVPLGGYYSAMLETGLLDLSRVKDLDGLISHLDRRGKRLLMMQMMQGGGPGTPGEP